ncbi:MAG: hypothetical protein P8Y27_02430 [Chromatiaceae bacterium]|jgi:hypothetical protein
MPEGLYNAASGCASLFVQIIPQAGLAPIFPFIGFEIVHEAYREAPETQSPAVSFAFLPTIANLVIVILGQLRRAANVALDHLSQRLQTLHEALTVLGMRTKGEHG